MEIREKVAAEIDRRNGWVAQRAGPAADTRAKGRQACLVEGRAAFIQSTKQITQSQPGHNKIAMTGN